MFNHDGADTIPDVGNGWDGSLRRLETEGFNAKLFCLDAEI